MDPPPIPQNIPLPPPVFELPRPPSIPSPPPIPSFLSDAGTAAPPATVKPPPVVATPILPPVIGSGMPIPPTSGMPAPPLDPFGTSQSSSAKAPGNAPPQKPFGVNAPTDPFLSGAPQRISQQHAPTEHVVRPQQPISPSAPTDPFSSAPEQRFSQSPSAQISTRPNQFSSTVPPARAPLENPFRESAHGDSFSPAPQQRFSQNMPAQVNAETNQFSSPPVPPQGVPQEDPFRQSTHSDPFSHAPQQRFSQNPPAQVNAQTNQFSIPVPPPGVPSADPFCESMHSGSFSSAPRQRFSQDAQDAHTQKVEHTNQFSTFVSPPGAPPQDPFGESSRSDPFSVSQQTCTQGVRDKGKSLVHQVSSSAPPQDVPPPQESINAKPPMDPSSFISGQSQNHDAHVSAQGGSFSSPDQPQGPALQSSFDVRELTGSFSYREPPPQDESKEGPLGVNAFAAPLSSGAQPMRISTRFPEKIKSKASFSSHVSSQGVPSAEPCGGRTLMDPFSSGGPSQTAPQEQFGKNIPTDPFSSQVLGQSTSQDQFLGSSRSDPFTSTASPHITPSQEPFSDRGSSDLFRPSDQAAVMEQRNDGSSSSPRSPNKANLQRHVSFSSEPPVTVPPPNPGYPKIGLDDLGSRSQVSPGTSSRGSLTPFKQSDSADAFDAILKPVAQCLETSNNLVTVERTTSVDLRVTGLSPSGDHVRDTFPSKVSNAAGRVAMSVSSAMSNPPQIDNRNTVSPPSVDIPVADVASVDGPRQGVVVVSGFGGKMVLCNESKIKVFALQDVISGSSLVPASEARELDQFPGPLGMCDKHTTTKLITFFENSERDHVHTPSDALMNRLLLELLRADGDRDAAFATFASFLGEARDIPADPHAPLRQMAMDLAQGRVDLALEQGARSNMMWPHVLVVSELVSRDAFMHTMARFATFMGTDDQPVAVNGPANDPYVKGLRQLYSLLAQETPVDKLVEEVADCWEPSVALITTLLRRAEDADQHAFLVEKYLVALGNKLAAAPYNDPTAAHICFLLTKVHQLESVDTASGVMAILGVEHRDPQNFTKLLNTRSFHWTETYEYIMRLTKKDYVATGFQPFKMVHAMTLAEYGMQDKAQKYLDVTNAFVKAIPSSKYCDSFRTSLRELGEQLKPSDVHPSNVNGPKFFAADVVEGMAGGVGNLFAKGAGIFKNVGAVTGLTTKPIGPPALGEHDDERESNYCEAPGGFTEPSFEKSPGEVKPPSQRETGIVAPPSEGGPSGFGSSSGQASSGFGLLPGQVSGGYNPPQPAPGGFPPPSGQAPSGFGPPPGQTPGGFPPPPGQNPTGFPPPPRQVPGEFGPPSEQTPGVFPPPPGQTQSEFPPSTGQAQGRFPPPSGQAAGRFPPPSGQEPGRFPPSGQTPGGSLPPSSQAPSAFPPPPGETPVGFSPPPRQMPEGIPPPGQATGGFGSSSGQTLGGFAPPPGQTPDGYGRPPAQTPGGFQSPSGQAQGGFAPPPGQTPDGYGRPPAQTPGGFQSPSGQAQGGFGAPLGGFRPPLEQPSSGSWQAATSQQTAGHFSASPPTASGSWNSAPLVPRPPSTSMLPPVQHTNTHQTQAPMSPLMSQRDAHIQPPGGRPPMGSYPTSNASQPQVGGFSIGEYSETSAYPPAGPMGGPPMQAYPQHNAPQPPMGAPQTVGAAPFSSAQSTIDASFSSYTPNEPSYGNPVQPPRELMPVDDPIVNAGKAVWGGVSSIWRGITQVAQKKQDDSDVYDKLGEKSTMYYDEVSKRWREHGKEDLDISQYDAQTGRVITPPPAAPPPAPPTGGMSGAPQTAFAGRGRRGLGAANLYVTPGNHLGSRGY